MLVYKNKKIQLRPEFQPRYTNTMQPIASYHDIRTTNRCIGRVKERFDRSEIS